MKTNCPDALRLMAYMDGELDPEEMARVSAHLSSCPDCSSFLATQSALERSWRDSWQDPPDFRFNAMRKKVVPGRRKAGLPGWAMGIAAGAAAVFLGIRVFQPIERPVLETRLRGEAASQVAPPDPAEAESPAITDSLLLLAEESQEPRVIQEETEEAAVEESLASGIGGVGGGMDQPVPVEITLSTGEDTGFQQSQEQDAFTGDLEGVAFAESPDDVSICGTVSVSAAYGSLSAGGGGIAAGEAETAQPAVSTVSSQPAGSSGRASSEVCRDVPDGDETMTVTLVCERPDGAPVSPWKELRIFVDSLLHTRSTLPAMFHIDPLGYTVEQDGIPRVYLGVDDPAVVPLTVRVLLH
jgi:hypothetical protein